MMAGDLHGSQVDKQKWISLAVETRWMVVTLKVSIGQMVFRFFLTMAR